jgi:predicted amidophosphoribosyltransferase
MAASRAIRLASIVAPPSCAACGAGCDDGLILCEECARDLVAARPLIGSGPPWVDLAVAASEFEGATRRIVHGLKYARRLALARVAAEAMLRALPEEELTQVSAVVPVPAGPWRWRWRGFDPAEEIAIALTGPSGLPLCACLRRAGGRRQVGRRRTERLADPPRVWVRGQIPSTALLVDDVWTTGATLSACGRALREAGSARVVALTLAHAL